MTPLLPVITAANAARLARVRQLGSPRTPVGRGQHLGFAPTGNCLFAKDKSFVPPPPNLIFMNRLQFGFYSVLSRLDVSVDYAAVEREFLGQRTDSTVEAAK